MDYREKRVKHSTFGKGTILSQDEKYLIVRFDQLEDTKKFVYPSCFDYFLKFEEEEINQEIQKEKQKARQAIEKQEKKAKQERIAQTKSTKTFSSVLSFCDSYQEEISKELSYLKQHEVKKYKIYEGKRLEKGVQSIYSFEMDEDLNLPAGVAITLWNQNIEYDGTIISCEDFTLLVYTSYNLGEEIPFMEFSAQAWMLLSKLKERLEELKERPSQIVRNLVRHSTENIDTENRKIRTGQEKAIEMALNKPITFIWGPPGTGKTQTLAKIAIEHMKQNHRILMVSYSNVSVDEAILRLSQLSQFSAGEIVRYGNARKSELKEDEYLTVDNLTIHAHPDLLEKRKQLKKQLETVNRTSSTYKDIKRELNHISAQLQEEKNNSIASAKFVATTISMAVVNKKIYESKYDVVIFDEASMAYIPQIVYAASLAKSHFICIGDFKQLPPIVQSGSNSKLNADIFDYCGISAAVKKGYNHNYLCMLDTQYRMHQDIANFVSQNFYQGLLKTPEDVSFKQEEIQRAKPLAPWVLSLIDLSNMRNICLKAEDKSHFNLLSAFLSFGLAMSAKDKEVGIITPYHAQSRLIHAMVRDSDKGKKENSIQCATVHQFQGSEKDIIIYDLVDSYPLKRPGILLESCENDTANRLFNVAMTRAKGKFIALGNIMYLKEKNLSQDLLFRKYIKEVEERHCFKQNKICRQITTEESILRIQEEEMDEVFYKDLKATKKCLQVDISGKINTNALKEKIETFFRIVKQLKENEIEVTIRVDHKENIPIAYQGYIIENNNVRQTITIIDKEVIWYGKPDSLNAIRPKDQKSLKLNFPCIRFQGKHTASLLINLLNMSDQMDHATKVIKVNEKHKIVNSFSTYVLAHKKCPECEQAMQIKKSSKGVYYLACTNRKCRHIEYLKTELVEDYLYRGAYCDPKCKMCRSSLEAVGGKRGVYLRCYGDGKHHFSLDLLFK